MTQRTVLGAVPDGWSVAPLRDIAFKIGSGATPRGGASVYVPAGIAFIRSQNVLDHRFSREGLAFIDDRPPMPCAMCRSSVEMCC